MKLLLLAALSLLSSQGLLFAETAYYRSNGSAMELERIASYRRDETEWVLSVQRAGATEVRTLLDKGKETRRWVRTTSRTQTEEKEYSAGVLTVRRVFDAAGSLLEEDQYEAGDLSTRTTFAYTGGRLVRTRTVDKDGNEISTAEYVYAVNGSLRMVRRTPKEGTAEQTTVVSGAGGMAEERTDAGGNLFIDRFDSRGRVTSQEARKDGQMVSREDFVFRTDKDVLASSTLKEPQDGTVIERAYDDEGRLSRETTTTGAGATTVVTWTRDSDGRVVARQSQGPAGLEAWKYSLRPDGSVSREEYYRRGSLEKVTIYGDGSTRTEEYYRDGEMFLRVFWDGTTRLKEEVWSNGTLMRTRSYQ